MGLLTSQMGRYQARPNKGLWVYTLPASGPRTDPGLRLGTASVDSSWPGSQLATLAGSRIADSAGTYKDLQSLNGTLNIDRTLCRASPERVRCRRQRVGS